MTLASMIRALAGYVGARFLGAGLGLLTQLALVGEGAALRRCGAGAGADQQQPEEESA